MKLRHVKLRRLVLRLRTSKRRPRPARRNVQPSLVIRMHAIRMGLSRARSVVMRRGRPGITPCGARIFPQPSQE